MRKETLLIRFLYQTVAGRSILKILVPWVSRKVGIFLNSKFSRWLVPVFVKKNGINMDEYEKRTISLLMIFLYGNVTKSGLILHQII